MPLTLTLNLKGNGHPGNAPMLKFFNELRDGGATIFLITSRPRANPNPNLNLNPNHNPALGLERIASRQSITYKELAFLDTNSSLCGPMWTSKTTCLSQSESPLLPLLLLLVTRVGGFRRYKSRARAWVAQYYTIIMTVGSQAPLQF